MQHLKKNSQDIGESDLTSQCLRMDLNKKSGTKQKAIAGSKGIPKGFKKPMFQNLSHWDAITKFAKIDLGCYCS